MKQHKEPSTTDHIAAAGIAALADLAVSKSLEQCMESFHAFKKVIEKQANESFGRETVLHVQVGEDAIRPMTQKPNPALVRLLANAKLGLYSLMVGPAGCGKTTAAHQVAEALGLPFGSVCLTAGASETWLFGRQTPTGFIEGAFSKIYREGGVFLADEMDAADANLLLSINTALSHNSMLNPMNGEFIKRHDKFIFIGAANTNGKGANHLYTGRSRLDAATLDRMVIIDVDYDEALEKEICSDNKKLFRFLIDTRNQLRTEGYDEFISTRAFIFCNKQLRAGVPIKDVKNSLTSSWGDAAKKTAERMFTRTFDQKERDSRETEKFYTKFTLPPNELFAKWRPIEWESI